MELKPGQPFFLRPLEFALGVTVEHIVVPDDLVARLDGKSSLGRVGLLIHATAGLVDPGWEGRLTLELMNLAPFPITLFAGMKIGQISFIQMTSPVDTPYGGGAPLQQVPGRHRPDAEPLPPGAHRLARVRTSEARAFRSLTNGRVAQRGAPLTSARKPASKCQCCALSSASVSYACPRQPEVELCSWGTIEGHVLQQLGGLWRRLQDQSPARQALILATPVVVAMLIVLGGLLVWSVASPLLTARRRPPSPSSNHGRAADQPASRGDARRAGRARQALARRTSALLPTVVVPPTPTSAPADGHAGSPAHAAPRRRSRPAAPAS